MVPDRDYYADKDGKLTTDASQAAIQIAVAGFELDPRVAKRYGITDAVVSVDEPGAVRRVKEIVTELESAPEPEPEIPAEAAGVAEPDADDKPAKKAASKKGKKK
jgi:hypothetical protein